MHYITRNTKVYGYHTGYLKDDDGRSIDVRYGEKGYMCVFRNEQLYAKTVSELIVLLQQENDTKRDWHDVIIITTKVRKSLSCPPQVTVDMSMRPQHVAKLRNGKFVWADWSPDVEHKSEHTHTALTSIGTCTIPGKIKPAWCPAPGEDTYVIPYSEDAMNELKAIQVNITATLSDQLGKLLNLGSEKKITL